jgi:hypothetical protein
VRESLVEWVRDQDVSSLPVQRVLVGDPGEGRRHVPAAEGSSDARDRAGLFSGTADGEARASGFTAAIPVVQSEDRDSREHPLADPARDD